MLFMVMFNLVALVMAVGFSDEWTGRGKLGLVIAFVGAWLLPGLIGGDPTRAQVVFVVAQLALALYLSFKLGVGHRGAFR